MEHTSPRSESATFERGHAVAVTMAFLALACFGCATPSAVRVSDVPAGGAVAAWQRSATERWLVGSGDMGGWARHWDGSSWQSVELPTVCHPNDIWGTSASDVWVACTEPAVAHWDGAAWTRQTIDSLDASASFYLKLGGSGANDVWLVGLALPQGGGDPQNVAAHWDGVAWTIVSSTPQSPSFTSSWVAGPNDVWVGTNAATVFRFDGTQWNSIATPPDDRANAAVFANVTGLPSGDVVAITSRGVYRWNGTGFAEQIGAQGDASTQSYLSAVAGRSASDLWATSVAPGTNCSGSGASWSYSSPTCHATDTTTQLLHWDGTQWVRVTTIDAGVPLILAGSRADTWFVGDAVYAPPAS